MQQPAASRVIRAYQANLVATHVRVAQPRMFSQPAMRAIVKGFRQPEARKFFLLYPTLFEVSQGGEPPEMPFADMFRASSRLVFRALTSDFAKNEFGEVASALRPRLNRLDGLLTRGERAPANLWREISQGYSRLIQAVAGEREVFLARRAMKGAPRWTFFLMMNEKQRELERVRRTEPELYDAVQESKGLLRELDTRIQQDIQQAGLEVRRKNLLGRVVTIGRDSQTGEEIVYDHDGERLTVPDFINKRKKKLREQRRLQRVFLDPQMLQDFRAWDPEMVDAFAEGEPEYIAMTDDRAKARAVTRVVQTRMLEGERIVSEGRFKGFRVADLVNRAGRMIEGTAYDYDPKVGRPVPIETRNPDGSPNVRVTREPYVTVAPNGKLHLVIPSSRAYTEVRNNVRKLSRISDVDYKEKSRNAVYQFDAKDFGAVREALGGLSMSQPAAKLIEAYFKELAGHERALDDRNLQNYEADRIGGFREGVTIVSKQKEALATAEARGWRGVTALDTGLGKTMTAIAAAQKMVRDGIADEEGRNGRFLYVAPTALKGNFDKEARKFLTEENAGAMTDRVDVMSYREFREASKKNPGFADEYVAVFFDEGQALKNPTSQVSRAAQALRHPRKMILTASALERTPLETFVLISITNNVDLNTREGRKAMRVFVKRFCEVVGGRVVGIKNDPQVQKDLRIWVRQNLYFADKRDAEELAVPELVKSTEVLTMPTAVERRYRAVTSKISKVMKGMVAKFRDRSTKATDPAIDAARVRLAREFSELQKLSNAPDEILVEDFLGSHGVGIVNQALAASGSKLVLTGDMLPADVANALIALGEGIKEQVVDHLIETDIDAAEALSDVFETGNPKLDHGRRIVEEQVGAGGRVIFFSDSPDMVAKSVLYQSRRFPMKFHGAGFSDRIELWQNGEKKRTFRRGSDAEWQVHVLQTVMVPNSDVTTLSLTGSYAVGQNLQTFDTVVHLDRDTWNSEKMKQRDARAHRTGQPRTVRSYTLDMVYSERRNKRDATLDEIRGYMQQMESDLFDEVIIHAQTEAMGAEWYGMARLPASFYHVKRRAQEAALSPYLARIGEQEGSE